MLDPRSVRGPGRSPCPDALLRVGVMRGDNGLVGVLMDGIEWWVTSVFWRINFEAIEAVFDVLTAFDISLSVPLDCFACVLPCCSFAKISPEVILRDEGRNVYICSIWNNYFIIKPHGWDFFTTPTRFKIWKVYFSLARISSALMLSASSFFRTDSASAFLFLPQLWRLPLISFLPEWPLLFRSSSKQLFCFQISLQSVNVCGDGCDFRCERFLCGLLFCNLRCEISSHSFRLILATFCSGHNSTHLTKWNINT